MHFSVAALCIAAVAASPISPELFPRASSTCSSMKSKQTTVGSLSATIEGPFYIKMENTTLKQNGFYAHAGAPSIYTTIIFDVFPPSAPTNATEFYLTTSGHLVTILEDIPYWANDVSPVYDGNLDDSNVVISPDQTIANKLTCKIKGDCTFNCGVIIGTDTYDYNCQGDPTFQPDWRIAAAKKDSGGGCIPFVAKAVPK